MIPIPPDFREFIQLLNEHSIKYLVVGGYAVAFHGYPRATGDLDIFVEMSQSNASGLVRVFERFGFSPGQFTPEFFLDEGQVVRIGRAPLRLEILNEISGVEFHSCYEQRISENIDGLEVDFIGLQDLLVNKKSTGRHKDSADVENLEPRE